MIRMQLIAGNEFQRVASAVTEENARLRIIADMCRANALTAVKRAGSGHLGSSFSSMDIFVRLYYSEMNTARTGVGSVDRDIFFSSKGHDVPGLYAVLYSLGIVPEEKLLKLRRLGGLDGHPDVGIPGIESNSGSLGMGISKARGMAWAKRYLGRGGRVFVMTGDGELQEGQNFEALQVTVQQGITNLTIIVDHNKVQSDKQVAEIVNLGDLEQKFRVFGWHVCRCDGNDQNALELALAELRAVKDRPKVLIADTIKGRGVSFMEHPAAMKANGGYYKWHSGAPADEFFAAGYLEIIERVNVMLGSLGLEALKLKDVETGAVTDSRYSLEGEPDSRGAAVKPSMKASAEFVADAYGQALVKIGARRKDLVVLDADLAADCRVRQFELTYPDRFIECGIAEQDMVSMAGGLARQGLLPVVNSFASFLASRSNEQIYNNASEKTKIIYVNHYAGLIPAGPGKSHQSIRDISLFGALPNCTIIQPCNPDETRMALEYAVDECKEVCMIRLVIGPSPGRIDLPVGYDFSFGKGAVLGEGQDALMFAYGPVMLYEALQAQEILRNHGFGLKVVNMPWLNKCDIPWLTNCLNGHGKIVVLEDHASTGGLGSFLLGVMKQQGLLDGRQFSVFGVDGYPACGTPAEALRYHRLDGASLAERIRTSDGI